jgi:tetratricopeptide (TPR) repeat protein
MMKQRTRTLIRWLVLPLLAVSAVIIIALLLQRSELPAPDFAIAPLDSVSPQARALLERAYQFETIGDYQNAETIYENALALNDAASSEYANQAILRIHSSQQNLGFRVRETIQQALIWFFDIVARGLLLISIVGIALTVFLFRKSRRDTISIVEFDDLTGTPQLETSLPRAIGVALHRIQHIHLNATEGTLFIADELDLPSTFAIGQKPPDFIDQVKQLNVSAFDIPIPIEEILRYVQRLGEERYELSGQITKDGSDVVVYAFVRHANDGTMQATWRLNENAANGVNVMNLAEKIAFNFLIYLSSNAETTSWQALASLTSALEHLQYYRTDPSQHNGLDEAIKTLEDLSAQDVDNIVAQYNLALAYMEREHYKPALQLFSKLREDFKAQHLKYQIAYNIGVCHFQILAHPKDLEFARKSFQVVTADQTRNTLPGLSVGESKRLLFLAYSGIAASHVREMRYLSENDQARQDCYNEFVLARKQALKSVTSRSDPLLCVLEAASAEADFYFGRYKDAETKLQNTIRLNPQYSQAYILLANVYEKDNHPERAIAQLEHRLKQRPNFEFCKYYLGKLWYEHAIRAKENGNSEQAKASLNSAVEVLSSIQEFALGISYLGRLYLENQELDKAIEAYRLALAKSQRLDMAWQGLAWALLERPSPTGDEIREARDASQRYLNLIKNNDDKKSSEWNAYALLGRAAALERKYSDAHRQLNLAEAQGPKGHPQPLIYLAQLYLDENNLKSARESVIAALKGLDTPDFKRLREVWHPRAVAIMQEIKRLESSVGLE